MIRTSLVTITLIASELFFSSSLISAAALSSSEERSRKKAKYEVESFDHLNAIISDDNVIENNLWEIPIQNFFNDYPNKKDPDYIKTLIDTLTKITDFYMRHHGSLSAVPKAYSHLLTYLDISSPVRLSLITSYLDKGMKIEDSLMSSLSLRKGEKEEGKEEEVMEDDLVEKQGESEALTQILNEDILIHIFSYLDPISFFPAAATCQRWKEITMIPMFWKKRVESKWSSIRRLAQENIELCENFKDSSSKKQVSYLRETLNEIAQKAEQRLESSLTSHYRLNDYSSLVHLLLSHLQEAKEVIQKHISLSIPLSSNFDVVDFTLRKSMRQIDSMFPSIPSSDFEKKNGSEYICQDVTLLKTLVPDHPLQMTILPLSFPLQDASSIIRDHEARKMWDQYIGANVACFPFKEFLNLPLFSLSPIAYNHSDISDFISNFSYFVDFPRDGMITTYKWSVIMDQFGPFHQFIPTFLKYACGPGFMGLMNTVEAEKLLKRENEYVIRFSRLEPEKLTFSVLIKNAEGVLVPRHIRKPLGVSISDFINQKFPRHKYTLSSKQMSSCLKEQENMLTYSMFDADDL